MIPTHSKPRSSAKPQLQRPMQRGVIVERIVERSADERAKQLRAPTRVFTRDTLSEDQVEVFDRVMEWAIAANVARRITGESSAMVLKLGGLAGTGKTTITSALAVALQAHFRSIVFCAYTGKATNVLARKLIENGLNDCACQTIHSLIKRPIVDSKTGKVTGWLAVEPAHFGHDFIVVDEASMVDAELWADLLAYNIPILAVGDHGQLPPVGSSTLNLMEKPDVKLEKIHRQAEGNPILALAQWVRAGYDIRQFKPTDSRVRFIPKFADVVSSVGPDHTVICFKNATRVQVNQFVRKYKGFTNPLPMPGEPLILLKNASPVFNGMRGTFQQGSWLLADDDAELAACIDGYGCAQGRVAFLDDNLLIEGPINTHQFNREKTVSAFTDIPQPHPRSWADVGLLFDYGYAMTCHKHQGSQSRECTVIVDRWLGATPDAKIRWLYTAVTRAAEQLNILFA